MAVDIQGKGGGGMAQVPLYGLDVIPGADRGYALPPFLRKVPLFCQTQNRQRYHKSNGLPSHMPRLLSRRFSKALQIGRAHV